MVKAKAPKQKKAPDVNVQIFPGNGGKTYITIRGFLGDGSVFHVAVQFDATMRDTAKTRYADLKTSEDIGDLLREFGTEAEYAIWEADRAINTGSLKKSLPLVPKPNTSTLLPFNQYDLIVVSFSGGKDSLACVLHLLELGVPPHRIELWHHAVDGEPGKDERFFDWPVTEAYCKSVAQALGIKLLFQWREGGFEREMFRNRTLTAPVGFERLNGGIGRTKSKIVEPTIRMKFPQLSADLSVRWCSSYIKIDVAKRTLSNDPRFDRKKILMLTGERRQESANRALYAEITKHSTSNKTKRVDHWRAILDWRESDVWAIIERHNIQPHPAYYAGFSRVSCMSCIFGNQDQWNTVRELSPHTFDKIARFEVEFGKFWDLPASRAWEKRLFDESNEKAIAKGEAPSVQAQRPYGRPMTIHREKSVTELANEGVSYLRDPKLTPAQRQSVQENAALAMSEEYGSARPRGAWVLPIGAYRHSGGPILEPHQPDRHVVLAASPQSGVDQRMAASVQVAADDGKAGYLMVCDHPIQTV